MYKTELHCHSKPVSRCADNPPAAVVDTYVAAGYSTIVLTNHLSPPSFEGMDALSWDEKIDYYMRDWEDARRAAGDRLHVLWGAELRLYGCDNDYLIYGVTEAFLRAHPTLLSMKLEEVSALLRQEGFLFVQAHPFRQGMKVQNPALFDGVEVYNGHFGHDSRNPIAQCWAEQYGKIRTGGSDYHHVNQPLTSGIETDSPITTSEQLLDTLRGGQYTLIRNLGR